MKYNEKECFIIAELSANHNGSLETAIETIKAAKRAGADGRWYWYCPGNEYGQYDC